PWLHPAVFVLFSVFHGACVLLSLLSVPTRRSSDLLAFQSVDDVHGGDGLALGVLSVGDGIADHVLQEHLQDTSSFLVDQAGDSLDRKSTRLNSSHVSISYAVFCLKQITRYSRMRYI